MSDSPSPNQPLLLVHRGRLGMYMFVCMACFFAFMWCLSLSGRIEPALARSWQFTAVVWGFVVPIGGYCLWIAHHPSPLIALYADRVELTQLMLPMWRWSIPLDDIVAIVADDAPDTARRPACEIRLTFTKGPASNRRSKTIQIFMTGATHTPNQAADAIRRQLEEWCADRRSN
jgi:hypothetical protein